MRYWRCNYHLIWSTKFRDPSITPPIELVIFEVMRQKAKDLKSEIFAVNGVTDHIHIALSIHPSIAVSKLVGELKGRSSHEVNHNFTLSERFAWQESFGVLTVGERQIEMVCDYVNRQKEHHQLGTVNAWLEYDALDN